jgi:hypothetical protein
MERKFKVGDRVMDSDFGLGTVMYDDQWVLCPYAVEFDNPTDLTVSHCKENHGIWLEERHLTLVEPNAK